MEFRSIPGAIRAIGLLVLAAAANSPAGCAAPQKCSLLPEHAAIIVMQTPAAVKAKAAGGCPAVDYQEKTPGMASFQLRDICSTSSDSVLGNYLVDLGNGKVWEEEQPSRAVESPALKTTRDRVCAMSVRGVVPSLQSQAKPKARRRPVRSRPQTASRKK